MTAIETERIQQEAKDLSVHPGSFIIAVDYDYNKLKVFIKSLLKYTLERQNGAKETIWLKGKENESIHQRITWSNSEIIDGQTHSPSGLNLPTDKPIILIIENFDELKVRNDQYMLSQIIPRILFSERELYKPIPGCLHPNSFVVISVSKGSKLDMKKISPWHYID
jgi:hypothetical protein